MESHILKDYLEYIQFEKGYSEHTLRAYSGDLRDFFKFLDQHGPERVQDVSHMHIRNFISRIASENGLAKSTIARKLACLRSFFKFMIKKKKLEENPASYVRTPKPDKKLPVYLEKDEMNSLLNAPSGNGFFAVRDRAILEFLYSTGVRVSELVALDYKDIKENSGTAVVKGKGDKERIVIIGRYAGKAVKDYKVSAEDRFGMYFSEDIAFFLNKYGDRISTRSIRRILKKYLSKAGLDSRVTPHTIRHTFATHLLQNGADLRAIQEFLGHENLSTTQIYTHLAPKEFQRVYRKAHPRS